MDGVGLIGAIVIGILAGWIAEKVMRRNHGILTNLIVGVVGAFLGAFLAGLMDIESGSSPPQANVWRRGPGGPTAGAFLSRAGGNGF